jgi:15-cis-phytoene synthase
VTAGTTRAAEIQAAYQHCETTTRQQAKNFAYGIALLPADKRRALSAVYAFARRIDDIGDGTLPAAAKVAALQDTRGALDDLQEGNVAAGDLVLVALRDAAGRFALPLAAFGELIDGCETDVRGVSYGTFADLEYYCRCVAGSIGRLSLGVFGTAEPDIAAPLADSLGVALQVTNILRDIREDLGNGRVYLPADDLGRFGCVLAPASEDGQPARIEGPMADVIRFEADRARDWYAAGMQLMPMLDRRSAACTGAMAGIYRRLLEHISARPDAALASRMSLPTREKAMLAAKALAGIGRPGRPWRPAQPAGTGQPAATGEAAATGVVAGTGDAAGTGEAAEVGR